MADPLTTTAAIAAAAVYACKTGYEYVLRSKNGNAERKQKCEASIIATTLQTSVNNQIDLLREIKEMQQDTRDGVRDLVTIQRQRGH